MDPFDYDRTPAAPVRRRGADAAYVRGLEGGHSADPVRSHDVVRPGHEARPARTAAGLGAGRIVGRGSRRRRPCPRHVHRAGAGFVRRTARRGDGRRSAAWPAQFLDAGKFLVTLGGEHSITSPIVGAVAARHAGVSVLQIDAHADLRDSYLDERHSHACAMRRTLDHAPLVQVGIRNISEEEAAGAAGSSDDGCSTTGTCATTRSGSTGWWRRCRTRSTSRSISMDSSPA